MTWSGPPAARCEAAGGPAYYTALSAGHYNADMCGRYTLTRIENLLNYFPWVKDVLAGETPHPHGRHCRARQQGQKAGAPHDEPDGPANHAFTSATGTVPHSGQRPGVARRSYPHDGQRL